MANADAIEADAPGRRTSVHHRLARRRSRTDGSQLDRIGVRRSAAFYAIGRLHGYRGDPGRTVRRSCVSSRGLSSFFAARARAPCLVFRVIAEIVNAIRRRIVGGTKTPPHLFGVGAADHPTVALAHR